MHQIVFVEDDPELGRLIADFLARHDMQVHVEPRGDTALACIQSRQPDLVLLDIMLPGMDGLTVCRELRPTFAGPIVMLTARGEEEDKVRGLEVGADDYITKPFSPKELTARIKAVMRRSVPTATEDVIDVQGLRLDPVSHRVTANDLPLDMGPTEFRLLHFFMTHPERVYSREQLLNNVWGTNVYVEDRTVDVHIRRLRKVMATTGHEVLIQTVRGAGYRFSSRI